MTALYILITLKRKYVNKYSGIGTYFVLAINVYSTVYLHLSFKLHYENILHS